MAVKLTLAAVAKRRFKQRLNSILSVLGPLLDRVAALEDEVDGLYEENSRKRKIDAEDLADEMSVGITKSTKRKSVEVPIYHEVEFARVVDYSDVE